MGDPTIKPKKTAEQLVDILEDKGITFSGFKRNDAIDFLNKNNNYFKLTSYRKNFPTQLNHENKVVYINLDFEHLVVLSRIDMQLRYFLMRMCLDIEHFVKVMLMSEIANNPDENGYDTVNEFISNNQKGDRNKIIEEIIRNSDTIYFSGLLSKHGITRDTVAISNFPIWAFIEVISFGTLITFLDFYYKKYNVPQVGLQYFMNKVKQVRNAAAHSACMINNLYADKNNYTHRPNYKVTKFAGDAKIGEKMRKSKFSNEVIYQITVVFYVHLNFVNSPNLKRTRYTELKELVEQAKLKSRDLFSKNDVILSSYEMLRLLSEYLYGQVSLDANVD